MALAAAMLTPACGNNAGKETKAEVQESAAVQANVTHLTKADFLAKVYNYEKNPKEWNCLLYTSPSPRDAHESRMPSSA